MNSGIGVLVSRLNVMDASIFPDVRYGELHLVSFHTSIKRILCGAGESNLLPIIITIIFWYVRHVLCPPISTLVCIFGE